MSSKFQNAWDKFDNATSIDTSTPKYFHVYRKFSKTKEKESRKKRKWTIKMNNETSKEESQKKLKLCMQNKIAAVIAS